MSEHDLSEGDEVYDVELDEVRTVRNVDMHGTVTWESGGLETRTSVASNLEREEGGYEVQD